MRIGVLKLHLFLPGCSSLKEKRSRIKPLQERLHREFNVSVAETDFQDIHQSAMICAAMVSSSGVVLEAAMNEIPRWIGAHFRDLEMQESTFEIIE
jgi:uncharacterized protein YlxP (DUF503 family)